ncbi:MAG: leucine-rich repeat protein [Acutalibacteraceae bacterium]
MKTVKKILACLLSILTICSCMGFAAFAEEVGGAVNDSVTWSFDTETGVLSINGTGEIPDYGCFFVNYRPIFYTPPWSDYADDILAVQIAQGVTRIGKLAFKGCDRLTTASFPDSVTSIGYCAFDFCPCLTSVVLPDGVTSIGSDAFSHTGIYSDASNWTDGVLYIGKHLIDTDISITGAYTVKAGTKCIADSAFFDCAALTNIILPSSVKYIGAHAFGRCTALTDITLPDGVTNICGSAFDDCTALENIFIPQSVTSIENLEDGTFGNGCTSLTRITVDPANPSYSSDENGVLFDKNKTTLFRFPVGSATTAYAVPNGVNKIEKKAFYTCASLETIMLPQGLEVISDNAFSGCTELRSVTFSNGLKSLGNYAFNECNSLTDITFPDGLKRIGCDVFYKCTSLTSITLPESAMSIHSSAFFGTGFYNDKSNWTGGVLYIGNHLIKAEYFVAGTYMVRPGTKSIADCAFTGCSSLNSIHIPAGVSAIGENILWGSGAYICSDTADCYAKEYADQYDIEFRVCDGTHPEAEMFVDILDNSGKKTLLFWESTKFEAYAQNLPADATLVWEVDKPDIVELKPSATGSSCKVTSRRNGTVNITLKAVHADGREVEGCRSDTVQVRSKTIGIYRILGFFRYLGDILILILNNGGCTGFPDFNRLF